MDNYYPLFTLVAFSDPFDSLAAIVISAERAFRA